MAALTGRQIAEIRRYRYEDGLTRQQTADLVGCSAWTVGIYAPGRPGKVPVGPVREAFLASGLSAREVARRLGWMIRPGKPDGSRVSRTIGIVDDSNHGQRSRRQVTDAETAGLIAEACGVARWEVGA